MILSCGEALIDMLPRESRDGEACFAPYPGGAVFNTAVALGRLGAPSGFLSGLSRDMFGDQLLDALGASKVDASLCVRSDRPCTLAFVRLVNGQASYAFYDEATAGRMLSVDDLPAIPDSTTAMFFGGIYLAKEPAGASYEALMTREAGRRVTMLDPNIRPGFITDPDAYRARVARMLALSDIVKLSDEDLHWLEGAGDLTALAQGLLAKGPKLVLITEGARGATAHMARGSVHVASQRVSVVDTVGAGDTFNAGVLAALHRSGKLSKAAIAALSDDDLREALTLGVRAAAVTVSRAGANPPWASEL
ncbi:carbohydrate kinase family protein [Frigidibacter sp. ROC022]|uniref:carbohydrate kinase family protein n=1 Tax=Frigidibacter sp. ROC022 TaxID=2971796 RepID=UPI00215B149B|nr:carbohydrate kinase [Frigidibacter sp. ROC022]MCR8722875.1 carbohydrate kinase [Frigidibacter sp. ROC022]